MTDIPLMEKLRFIGGARFEYTYIFTESLNQDQQDGEIIQPDILPSINLSYSLNDESNLRMAYNRTLARPSFREMAPFASFDFVGDFIFIGNPNLKRTLIDNIDLRWEWFFGPGEMVSISAFYKNFTDPIERSFNIRSANPELTVRNVDLATVTGIEFELRKQLDFISFLKDVNIGTNITLVKSQVSIDSEELSAKREFDPSFGDTRVMFGQAPYVLNAFLSYFNKKFGVEMNIAYNTSGEKLAFVNAKQVPDIYEQPRGQLDFNIKKDIGDRISIKFAVKNLLDESYSKSYYFKGISYIFEEYALGRTFSLGFNYSID
jgi:TonB-dependent receptor